MSEIGRIAVMTAPGELVYQDYPVPRAAEDEIVLGITRANVCGSELHIWNGKHPVKRRGGLGHEMLGRVVELGERRRIDNRGESLAVGDRVVVTYFQTCEECFHCLQGERNLCDRAYEFFAKQPEEAPHFHSAFASHYVVHPRQHVFRVPDAIPDAVAAGVNCALSQVLFGLSRTPLGFGSTLLVQGAGGLGLNAIPIAKELGARVVVIDGVASRLELAGAFGADHVIDMTEIADVDARVAAVQALTGGRGPDVALEVTGVPAAFGEGLRHVRRGGTYLVMGNLSPGAAVPFDPGYVTRKALTIRHVDRYEARYLARALDFVGAHLDRYPFARLVDAEFGFDQIREALDQSLARTVTRAAIVLP
ncbi:zinc-binding dehydrogenase [Leucobacter allii]|uniref:Zinc-binding dehydrogenase n=1 Tax=Leucobacter allii TaxID=2932247 RepID=A0ABY4FNN8_9MICO|nr:zinc-binding dehydrogenase [Leucobacter allii]UOQ57895.1 zinc-binding dehydrogenase [Leucobacter allii]